MHRFSATHIWLAMLLALSACAGGQSSQDADTTPTPTRTPTVEESSGPATSEPTTSAASSPTLTPTPTDEAAFPDGSECENEELGYEVEYPAGWWANDRIDPSEDDPGFTPIVACTYFAPSEVELTPNAGLPPGIAIQFGASEDEPVVSGTVIEEADASVDGREAVRREEQPEPSAGFIPEGSLIYRYVIELDGGYLVASTDNILQDDEAYEESMAILDAMMETLDIDD